MKNTENKIPPAMTDAEADIKCHKLNGVHAKIIKDKKKSSPELRFMARQERKKVLYALKYTRMPKVIREDAEKKLSEINMSMTYWRYKIGWETSKYEPFTIFTLLAQGDSWEDCFQRAEKKDRSNEHKTKGSS